MSASIEQVEAEAKQIALQLIADRCKVDLYYLCAYVLGGEEVLDPKVHGPLCRALRPLIFYQDPTKALEYEFPSDYGRTDAEGMPNKKEKQEFLEWLHQFEPNPDSGTVGDKLDVLLKSLLALMPRGTLKSTIITIGFTIQWHLNFPEDRVLIDSETFTKSNAFLAEIKGHYESNEKLRDIFGTIYRRRNDEGVYVPIMPDANHRKDKWSDTAINLACRGRKRKEESISCAGIDVTKNGMHYDLVIMDDLHSDKNTRNAEQIQQVKDHYRLVYSLLDPGKPSVVVGTRWDDDDLYQMIIDEEQEDFNFISRAAEAEDGALFYPRRLDRAALDRFRRKQGSYIYSCQYLNNPVDNQTATFKRDQFVHVKRNDIKDIPINWYGLVDPSYKGEYSDYAALEIGGMDDKGRIYNKFVYRQKMLYSEIIDKMYELDALFNPQLWLLEVIGTKTLEHDLERAQERASLDGRKRLKVRYIRSQGNSKEDRIKALAPYYERGDAVHVVDGNPQLVVLEQELLRFPKSKNDDASDCWSGILRVAQRARAHIPEETSQKRKNYVKMLNKPRSPMVGY